jgi:ferric-dicitrate binding protein FerR (iron transport regulator)
MPESTPPFDDDLSELLEAVANRDLTSDQRKRLAERLAEDSDARKAFIQATALDAMLSYEFPAGDLRLASSALQIPESDELQSRSQGSKSYPLNGANRWLLAVASLAGIALLLLSLAPRLFQPGIVATLESSENAAWESRLPTIPGSELRTGLLQLKSGIATLRFESGAIVILEAPAQLELVSAMRGRLLEGTAVVEVPKSAIGFIIETPDGLAIDYGTRFAVRVDSTEGRSDFELIEGEIGVHDTNADEEVRLTEPQKAVTVSKGSVSLIDVGQQELPDVDAAHVIRIDTNGRATTIPPASRQQKFNNPEVLAVKAVGAGNGKWDFQSCFAFDLSRISTRRINTARLRLNLVPSQRGYASRLPLINRFGVYGLTNAEKADWTVDGIWEKSPRPADGVLLGTFEVPRSQQRGTFGIEGKELLEFLGQHSDDSVTFILVRETTQIEGEGRGLTHMFASDSHPEAVGPLLELTID